MKEKYHTFTKSMVFYLFIHEYPYFSRYSSLPTFPADGGELISTAEAAEYDNCYKNDNPNVIIKSISQAT